MGGGGQRGGKSKRKGKKSWLVPEGRVGYCALFLCVRVCVSSPEQNQNFGEGVVVPATQKCYFSRLRRLTSARTTVHHF